MIRTFTALLLATVAGAAHALDFPDAPKGLKLNEIQVLGTHNSYALPADPRVMAIADPIIGRIMSSMTATMPAAQAALFREEHPNDLPLSEGLNYRHPDLKTQLDAGLRSLEIDVNPDPKGGLFLDPAGYRALRAQGVQDLAPHDVRDLDKPGFKVLHMPDIDFRSHCPTLQLCLKDIREWSDAHPGHAPLFIMLEAKSQVVPIFPNPTQVTPFDAELFDALDKELIQGLGRSRIITPDDVRGSWPTLNAAIRAGAWPSLESARGKVVILMLTATGKSGTEAYVQGRPSLEGRVAFLRSYPGDSYGAFLLLDNAKIRGAEITDLVKQGYLVRTRTDIETYEAKVNDPSRAKAAFESGAQVVSTDFFRPGNVYGTSYVVRLPGGGPARCNPVLRPDCR